MKKILVFTVVLLLAGIAGSGQAQQPGSQKKAQKASPTGEIQLDALHVEAHIEKPSVSIVPKRIEPQLEEVEFILRDFSRELRRVPRSLFNFDASWDRVEKIRNLEILLGSSYSPQQKKMNRASKKSKNSETSGR